MHQGGSGTTAQAMLAGRPMLIVPYGWDQPDNAARIVRQGSGLTIARPHYSAETASLALRRLLQEPAFAASAARASGVLKSEDALDGACNAIEKLLAAQPGVAPVASSAPGPATRYAESSGDQQS